MNEIILIIIISFSSVDTEVYEYPVSDMTRCVDMLNFAKVAKNTSAFCALKPKK